MTLQPWRRIVSPRQEIADGSFGESQFASDLGLVERGDAADEYRVPARFFEQTYLTDALRDVLLQLADRLGGNPAARAVYWMRTDFGGGKTHTLLAAYHLFRDPAQVAATDAARKLGAQRGNRPIPKATVVVLDGSALSPGVSAADPRSPGWRQRTPPERAPRLRGSSSSSERTHPA